MINSTKNLAQAQIGQEDLKKILGLLQGLAETVNQQPSKKPGADKTKAADNSVSLQLTRKLLAELADGDSDKARALAKLFAGNGKDSGDFHISLKDEDATITATGTFAKLLKGMQNNVKGMSEFFSDMLDGIMPAFETLRMSLFAEKPKPKPRDEQLNTRQERLNKAFEEIDIEKLMEGLSKLDFQTPGNPNLN